MNRPEIAPEVRRFVLNGVPSVPYLEAALLLHAEPQAEWDAQRRGSRIPQAFVAATGEHTPLTYLVRLVAYGLILLAIWQKNRSR